jgi:hypothetical protein
MTKFKIDFLGIGAEKAATYWIYYCLKEHPEVCFPNKKEVFFFNEYDPHLLKIKNLKYKRGISWYKRQFSGCLKESVIGEISPTYLYGKKTAKRIKKHFPDVKLIACLRDPTKRAFSQFIHDKSIGVIRDISFEEALNRQKSYVEKGLYLKHLKHYLRLFPRKNILIILVDDIKTNPKKVIKKIYKHVGVKNVNYFPKSTNKKENVASQSRFHLLNYLLIHIEYVLKRNNLVFLLRLLEKLGIRKLALYINFFFNRKPLEKYPKMKKSTEIMLRRKFLKDTTKLERLINRNLSSWKKI